MKKERLLSYSLLSAAFLLLDKDASGQVWYKDYMPDTLIYADSVIIDNTGPFGTFTFLATGGFPIDLNNDGIDDFRLNMRFKSSVSSTVDFSKALTIELYNSNRIATSTDSFYFFHDGPARLPDGAVVDSSLDFPAIPGSSTRIYLHQDDSTTNTTYGFWQNAGDSGAIGLKINISGQPHYGWMRLKRIGYDLEFEILDYMLSAVPNKATTVGEDPCQRPFNLAVNILSLGSANISWEEVFDTDQYQIRAREAGTTVVMTGTSLTNTKFIGGLVPGKTYEWQVRSRCNDGSLTPFSALNSFTMPLLSAPAEPAKPGLQED